MNPSDPNKIELSFSQNFELEKLTRSIDTITNVKELQDMAKSLASLWMTQRAAVNWVIRQNISKPSPESLVRGVTGQEKE